MDSVANLSNLSSLTVYTLKRGALTERLILGSALAIAGIFIAQTIYKIALYVFSKPQQAEGLTKPKVDKRAEDEYEQRLREQVQRLAPPPAAPKNPSASSSSSLPEPQAHSLLTSLMISGKSLSKDEELQLAEALHAYQEFKAEIGGDEERFVFLAEQYLRGELLEKLTWEARGVELEIPSHFNGVFKALQGKLQLVRLTLAHVKKSDQPIAKANFTDNHAEAIYDLGNLYKTVKLTGPHILISYENSLKKDQILEVKKTLHKTRFEIMDKILSTMRAVLINEFVASFPEKQKELFPFFGKDVENLRFVVENSCWLALNHALEWIEITFVPTDEKQKELRQSTLETLLKEGVPEGAKREQAKAILLQISQKPHDSEAIQSLVQLFQGEKEPNSSLQTLLVKVQAPKLQVEEERVQQELGRLESVQKFYKTVSFAAGVVDQGKNALHTEAGPNPKKRLVATALPLQPVPPPNQDVDTYARQINQVSLRVVEAGEKGITTVIHEQLQSTVGSIEKELVKIPNIPKETVQQIVQQGWIEFADKQLFINMTGQQRWIITQAMILQKLNLVVLEDKGKTLVHEVGKWSTSFVKTLYGRFVTALLAFEQRTHAATPKDPKPADEIARAIINPLLESYHALQLIKKSQAKLQAGQREDAIVKELVKSIQMHPNASNGKNGDAVFLGKLILELLSVLQPQGLAADIHKIFAHALSQPGELEPTLLKQAIEKYKKMSPTIEPWLKPAWNFILQGVENYFEKQSKSNMASLMSDGLEPQNVNGLLVDLLAEDTSTPTLSVLQGHKSPQLWYQEDEDKIRNILLPARLALKGQISTCENLLLECKKNSSLDAQKIAENWVNLKKDIARLDNDLFPLLLRRIIVANVPATFAGYVLQFVGDLHELLQYPKILRNMVFKVLEKTVQSLAHPLEEGVEDTLLGFPISLTTNQPVADLLFSDLLKTDLGDKLLQLVWSLSPPQSGWSPWALLAQTATIVVPGHFVFAKLQKKIEELVQTNLKNREATNWSVAKVVTMMNATITRFATDPKQGMATLVATQLNKAFESKPSESV